MASSPRIVLKNIHPAAATGNHAAIALDNLNPIQARPREGGGQPLHQRRPYRHPAAPRGHDQHGWQEPALAKAGGRYRDNIFVERLWRSLKYEEVYLSAYATVAEAKAGIGSWLGFHNEERQHQSLGYRTPRQVYEAEGPWICGTIGFADRLRPRPHPHRHNRQPQD